MRRTLHIITAALGLLGGLSALARGQEADLLPALLALDPAPAVGAHIKHPACPACEYGWTNAVVNGVRKRVMCQVCGGTGRQTETVIPTTGTTPASPAPVTAGPLEPAVQASTSAPPAAGSFIGRIPVLSLEAAKASPKPDFFFVTDPIASRCPACEQAKRLFLDERLQRWLALFDVVVCHEVEGDARPSFPQWAFASSDWQRYKRFVPGNPDGQGVTVEGCMRRFHEAWGVVR